MWSVRMIIILLVICATTYFFLLQPLLFAPKLPPSQLLKEIVQYLDFVKATDEKTIEMLNQDPFHDLVNEVRPFLDDLQSLKKQTSIYERMEQIPGGPQSFIKSALANIENIQDKVLMFEKRYRLIVVKMNKNKRAMVEQYFTKLTDDLIRVLETMGNELQEYKLYFLPDANVVINPKTVNIELIKRILYELSNDFAEVEKLYPGVHVLSILTANPDVPKLSNNPDQETIRRIEKYAEISDKIMTKTVKHGDSTLNGVNPYVLDVNGRIKNRMVEIIDHQNRVKERYEKLVDGIDLDVTSTRERIKNLGKSRPRKVEL